MKGEVISTKIENLNINKIIEKQQKKEETVFSKIRPKSSYHGRFLRLNTGIHGIYHKKNLEKEAAIYGNLLRSEYFP